MAFAEVGVELEFKGEGSEERGYVAASTDQTHFPVGKEVVAVDPNYYRPTEVDLLIGNPNKANTVLGWKPKYTLAEMVKEMVESDLRLFRQNKLLQESGFDILRQFE
jgi:GDPmannose 4,6-dehydratase